MAIGINNDEWHCVMVWISLILHFPIVRHNGSVRSDVSRSSATLAYHTFSRGPPCVPTKGGPFAQCRAM